MDDVLIIILTLVLTVVAAINQAKKKKQQTNAVSEAEPGFWESLMQEADITLTQVKNQPVTVTSEPVPVKPASRAAKSRDSVRKSATADTGKIHHRFSEGGRNEAILTHLKSQTSESDELSMTGNQPTVLEEFSLRNAIIYSEIIHPKYF
jgi:hypothetical protein